MGPLYIRLIFASSASLCACGFVHMFSLIVVRARIRKVLPLEGLPVFTRWVLHGSAYAYAIPIAVALACLWCLRRGSTERSACSIEVGLGALKLFTIAWPLVCLVAWELPYIGTSNLGGARY